MANPALWYLLDRSKPGLLLSTLVGIAGTVLLLALNPDMLPPPSFLPASSSASSSSRSSFSSSPSYDFSANSYSVFSVLPLLHWIRNALFPSATSSPLSSSRSSAHASAPTLSSSSAAAVAAAAASAGAAACSTLLQAADPNNNTLPSSNSPSSALSPTSLGPLLSTERVGAATWIASVLFCSCVCFGNIGRRLALSAERK